jgi:sulfate transport system substrate-binding protein
MNQIFSRFRDKSWFHKLFRLLGAILLSLIITLIWCLIQHNKMQHLRLVVYAFSTQEEAMTQGIFPAFKHAWETENGHELTIEGVFGPSGTLAGQINLGAPADVAIFSNQRHIDWLKLGKRVRSDAEPVLIAATPLVIVTRLGNPLELLTFADLSQPGLQLLHADPRSSGVGEWAVLAEYGSAYLETSNPDYAESQLKDIWQNVSLVGPSARDTLTLFEHGAGDALVTYEQDAFLANQRSLSLEIITPPRTMLARHYAVIVDDNVTSDERAIAEAFLAFILSDTGQQILSQFFFRTAASESESFPELLHPFTEEDLGGWALAYNRLIENYWKTEIEPGLKLEPATTFLGRGE